MVLHKCSECVYYTKRKFDLKRHMKNVHGTAKKQLFLSIIPMQSDIWEMDYLDVNRRQNQKMACILKKSSRKLWLLYELGFQQ